MTWAAFKLLLGRVPAWVWLLLASAVALLAFGEYREHQGRAAVQAKFDAHLSADRGAEAVAKQRARLEEIRLGLIFDAIGATHDQEMRDAIAKERATAADVLSGALRLRQHWACKARDLPGAAGSAEVADEGAELRAAAAGRIVRIGAEADAQVKGLQELLKAERARPIAR